MYIFLAKSLPVFSLFASLWRRRVGGNKMQIKSTGSWECRGQFFTSGDITEKTGQQRERLMHFILFAEEDHPRPVGAHWSPHQGGQSLLSEKRGASLGTVATQPAWVGGWQAGAKKWRRNQMDLMVILARVGRIMFLVKMRSARWWQQASLNTSIWMHCFLHTNPWCRPATRFLKERKYFTVNILPVNYMIVSCLSFWLQSNPPLNTKGKSFLTC